MRRLKFVLLLAAGLGSGCSNLQAVKLFAPESFGLVPVTASLYVEAGADEPARARLREAVDRAEIAIRGAYAGVKSRPVVNACITERCYQAFGGRGVSQASGDRILLSPRGLNWHFVAHEWSHVEIQSRLTFRAWWDLPRWFDEGLAVAISEAPEHSEAHWQFLVASDIPRPTREQLHSFRSLRQWLDAVRRYGETGNAQRQAKGETAIRPVYSAAGHEVRPWLEKAGQPGLLGLIERLNDGEEFDSVYQAVP